MTPMTMPTTEAPIEPHPLVREITIPGLPPSVNNLYPTGADGRRHLAREARDWHTVLETVCLIGRVKAFPPHNAGTLHFKVAIDLVGMDYRRDIDGALKVTLDGLAACLAFDDRWVDELKVRRLPLPKGAQAHTVVRITSMATD